MDMSLIAAALSAQAGAVQMKVAASILKSNMNAEKSVVATLLGAAQSSQANLGAGVGSNLDISV